MDPFLAASDVVDFGHPAVAALARELARGAAGVEDLAARAFTWVRDEVRHSLDHQLDPTTCSASDVATARHGTCYAKDHLLVALLRANGIRAGFAYQRLANGATFALHGLVWVELPKHGWYCCDPRGQRPGVHTEFSPPVKRLAYEPSSAGEREIPGIRPEPLPVVVTALRANRTCAALVASLPDAPEP